MRSTCAWFGRSQGGLQILMVARPRNHISTVTRGRSPEEPAAPSPPPPAARFRMLFVPRFGAPARIAPAVLVAALLWVPAALEGFPQQPGPTGASDFATASTRAEAAREAGRLDEAVSLYRKALALRPTWKDGWWALGTILYEQDAHSGRRARVSTSGVARSEERHGAPDAGAVRVPARRRRQRTGEHPDRENARGADRWRPAAAC